MNRSRRSTLQPLAVMLAAFALLAALPACNGAGAEQSDAAESGSSSAERDRRALPDIYSVLCAGRIEGCPCYENSSGPEEAFAVYHKEAAYGRGRSPEDLEQSLPRTLVAIRDRVCWMPANGLQRMEYAPVLRSPLREGLEEEHAPVALARLVPGFSSGLSPEDARRRADQMQRKPIGRFFATYYHLADEYYHPGPEVPVLTPAGDRVGSASKEFLEQVMWQGSGIAKSGLRLHYSGIRLRYNRYPDNVWGWGAGHGYLVWPYRTIAVNFKGFCEALGLPAPCGKAEVIGTLVRIREVADREIPMPGGGVHDGYFCANDTGSPNYIKADRIDIFAGVHGGGNPYLPPARRGNALIDGGIENLVPSDWRLWKTKDDRVWCPPHRIPADPENPQPGDCTHDYRTVARHKALHIEVVLDEGGRPVKCEKRP